MDLSSKVLEKAILMPDDLIREDESISKRAFPSASFGLMANPFNEKKKKGKKGGKKKKKK